MDISTASNPADFACANASARGMVLGKMTEQIPLIKRGLDWGGTANEAAATGAPTRRFRRVTTSSPNRPWAAAHRHCRHRWPGLSLPWAADRPTVGRDDGSSGSALIAGRRLPGN